MKRAIILLMGLLLTGRADAQTVWAVYPRPFARVAAVAPGAITGTKTVCVGSTTALANSAPGGTWSSSNTGTATVNGSGVVTGMAGGTVTISYATGAGTATATVTVNPVPNVYDFYVNRGSYELSGSDDGARYYFYLDGVNTGIVNQGDGSAPFTLSLYPLDPGVLTVKGLYITTGCGVFMNGSETQ